MSVFKKIKSLKNHVACWWLNRGQYKLIKVFKPKTVFLVMTPGGGNLGDHAIAETEKAILNELRIPYKEILLSDIIRRKNLPAIMNGKTILVNGGGNLGTLWFEVEIALREIIKKAPDSNIILLPNTIVYEDSSWGNDELEQSKKIYNAHKHLKIYARERNSYEMMKSIYKDVSLVPDVVFSRRESKSDCVRKGCIMSLRRDIEKTRLPSDEASLISFAETTFDKDIRYLDTDKDYAIACNDRLPEINRFLDEYRSAELVITDRLHGMIFAAITGTPCIVINSRSPKVKGCYEWIKNFDYIKFCDDVNKIEEIYRSIPEGPHKYDNSHLQPYFDELKKDIIAKAKRGR